MDVVKKYGQWIEKTAVSNPQKARQAVIFGLQLELQKLRRRPDRRLPSALQDLNREATRCVLQCLQQPQRSVWNNIFAPTELLQAFDLNSMSMECISSYLSGFLMEDYYIDEAEKAGIADTLCSYHKNFIGAAQANLLPPPLHALTTSTVCDGNISSFRYLLQTHRTPSLTVLDIPYQETEAAHQYVKEQLQQLIAVLQQKTGTDYQEEKLKQIIHRENESRKHYLSFLQKRRTHLYPSTPGMVLFLLLATHLYLGSQWVLDVLAKMDHEIEAQPACGGEKHLFWMHLSPYAEPALNRLLSYDTGLAITADDFNLDFTEMLDEAHPLDALAHKLIANLYNGPFTRKRDACLQAVSDYACDGAVQFCHWGCKQSSGSAYLMKEAMNAHGIPMLILDSDALDRRNMHDAQIATRMEAFQELLNRGGMPR